MDRPIDHSAVLLPGNAPRSAGKVPWGRLFFAFMYVTASAGAVVLLGLAWRHEVDRRHAAEGRAATSDVALETAAAKIATLEDRNQALGARAERLTAGMSAAQRASSRRGEALRDTRGVLRATKDFVAALDGLEQTAADTVKAETDLTKAEKRLTAHIEALSRYVGTTGQPALDRAILRARLRVIARDLEALQGALGRLTAGKEALDKAGEPLGQTQDLGRSLDSAIARTKAALRR
jgi:prefoldin subunit 5